MANNRIRVILNDRCLRGPRTGVGHYITQLLSHMPQVAPEIQIFPFYQTYCRRSLRYNHPEPRTRPAESQTPTPSIQTAKPHPSRPPRRWPWWLRWIAEETYNTIFEAAGLLHGCQLYHEPNHIPAPWPGPIVTTLHDLSVLRFPQWHPPDRVKWYEKELFASLPRSEHFITVSQFSKQEIVDILNLPPNRITSIPLGSRAIFHPRPPHEITAQLTKHNLPESYLLYVGTVEPRKNVPGVLTAYAHLPPDTRRHTPLVIVGASAPWARQNLNEMIRHHHLSDHVRVLGYLDDETLAHIYAGARALVWPTFYEGFGLPPLECMASGTPVITSNTCSLPEVVGDAGIQVDPTNTREIAEAIQRLIEDHDFAATLSQKGLTQAAQFSWSRCAAEHAKIYCQLATP